MKYNNKIKLVKLAGVTISLLFLLITFTEIARIAMKPCPRLDNIGGGTEAGIDTRICDTRSDLITFIILILSMSFVISFTATALIFIDDGKKLAEAKDE